MFSLVRVLMATLVERLGDGARGGGRCIDTRTFGTYTDVLEWYRGWRVGRWLADARRGAARSSRRGDARDGCDVCAQKQQCGWR